MALVTCAFHLAIAILLEAVLMPCDFCERRPDVLAFLQGLGSRLLPIWLASFTDRPAQTSIGKM